MASVYGMARSQRVNRSLPVELVLDLGFLKIPFRFLEFDPQPADLGLVVEVPLIRVGSVGHSLSFQGLVTALVSRSG